MPSSPWLISQSWQQLLFIHWPVPAAQLRALVPEPLSIDEYGQSAYVAVAPFHLTDFRFRPLPQLPFASEFPELNVRTYVTYDGKPGVYFFSLDAASEIAVLGARFTFGLPYFKADMSIARDSGEVHYRSVRTDAPAAAFEGRYRPVGEPFVPEPGSLPHFLTERYALYTVSDGHVSRADIHHEPWSLQRAELDLITNTMTDVHGIKVPAQDPILHYAERQDTLIWMPGKA